MSTVDKMLIKGIRSFDPENKHVITFFRPLTLIVGPNGAGKTTIIECLKLACTGELPPNSRSGHTFIHDPKVAGETETKGQIKLRFKTAAGKDVVCIRSFQLTQKASKMEFKALESVLQTINPHTGEKVCLSYRCADMDREIPALMGVSKAILENVIFVHQDDSNWPVQDPSTLKKKFDDIFSATRYTKALEVIKKLHKDQAQEIKTYKLKLENLQTLKDAAYKLRESISQEQEKSEALKAQIKELERNIQDVEDKIFRTETALKELRRLQDQISRSTTERSTLFKRQLEQYAALSEDNEDTDEELKEWQAQFEKKIASLESEINKLKRELDDEIKKSSTFSGTIRKCMQEIGKLQAEADAHMSLKHERDSTIQRILAKHNLGFVPDAPFNEDVAASLTNRIKSRLLDMEKDLREKMKANETELKFLWERYVKKNAEYSEKDGQRLAKIETKGRIKQQLKERENERNIAEHELSSLNLPSLDEKERKLEVDVERKIKALAGKDFESIIAQKRSEVFRLEYIVKNLNREKITMASDSEDRVKLGLKKEELENCRRKIKKMMDECKEKIRAVLKGRLPSEKDLAKEIVNAFRSVKKEHDDLNAKTQEAEKEVNMIQRKIEDSESCLSKLHRDMDAKRRFLESKLQSLIPASAGIDSFPKVILQAMESRDMQKSKYNIADGMRQMFDPFERVARSFHICPCCERPFSPEEEDEFVEKQRSKSASSAQHVRKLAEDSSEADSHFQQLDKLRMVYEEYIKLGKETIPLAEKTLRVLKDDLDQKSQAYEDLLGVLAHVGTEKNDVEALVQPAETVERLFAEAQILESQVDELEYTLNARVQGVKSPEEIQEQLDAEQSKKEQLSQEIDRLKDEHLSLSNELSKIQLRWHTVREEKLKASSVLDKFKKAEEDLIYLAEELSQVDLDEKHFSEAIPALSKEKEKLMQEHTDLKKKLEQEYHEQAETRRSFQQEYDMLMSLTAKIKGYLDSNRGEKLKDLQENLAFHESELKKCEDRKQEILSGLQKREELVNKQDQLKKNIDDNLNYRKTKAEVHELEREIEVLEKNVQDIGGMSAVEAELKRHLQERDKLLSELNRCHGTLSVYQSNISKHKNDLKQAQYTDIDKRYFDQLIQLKTTEMANKDLDRYYNALDKALMRFHSMKMEEINKIIRELWQQTYRGQDIDYISIHSDSEGAGTRSYSYRVLMQTGDAELEMRGRCSAGQKVLASLIIRLALAETFCLNCGILALDEPTTNLDGPNSESLAAALLRIMEDRKGQENFQLIVITHDERFAQLIGQRQHAERYYRVTKDEHQHSIIEAQEIFD